MFSLRLILCEFITSLLTLETSNKREQRKTCAFMCFVQSGDLVTVHLLVGVKSKHPAGDKKMTERSRGAPLVMFGANILLNKWYMC